MLHNLEASSVFVTGCRDQGTGVRVELAVVRSLGAPRRVETTQEREDFEQELLDQYLLAAVGAGVCDATVNENRSVIFEFARFLGLPATRRANITDIIEAVCGSVWIPAPALSRSTRSTI